MMLHHPIHQLQPLPHRRPHRRHLGLAARHQPLAQGLHQRVLLYRAQGRHRPQRSHPRVALFGQPRGFLHRASRAELARVHPSVGDQLVRIREAPQVAHLAQQVTGCPPAHPLNARHQVALAFALVVVVDVLSIEIQLPSNASSMGNQYAKFLFDISSEIPPRLLQAAQEASLTTQPNARGLVFNASTETLIKLLTFGSSVAR